MAGLLTGGGGVGTALGGGAEPEPGRGGGTRGGDRRRRAEGMDRPSCSVFLGSEARPGFGSSFHSWQLCDLVKSRGLSEPRCFLCRVGGLPARVCCVHKAPSPGRATGASGGGALAGVASRARWGVGGVELTPAQAGLGAEGWRERLGDGGLGPRRRARTPLVRSPAETL